MARETRNRCRNSVAIFCTLQSEYTISVSAVSHISDLYGVSSVLPDCPEPVCDLLLFEQYPYAMVSYLVNG